MRNTRNINLLLQYDGTRYHGWQIQPDKPTVCGELKQRLERILNERTTIYASSRTDSGVHALCQVVNFRTSSRISPGNIMNALNGMLPGDISITGAEAAPDSFHSCYCAVSRKYRYTIRNGSYSPFDRFFSCHFPRLLDASKMREASACLVGTHDFSAFKSARGEKRNRVRTVMAADVLAEEAYVYIDIEADGFLTYMVRNIAGTLAEAGMGRLSPAAVEDILLSGDRRKAGPTLPARGLCLLKVNY